MAILLSMTKYQHHVSICTTYTGGMNCLNYQHLRYFWVVAREGGLVPAGRVLRLSHPTLSAQIHALEDRLGEKLFTRAGRKLALTDVGRVALRYADEIFGLGNELVDAVRGKGTGRLLQLDVGVVDVLPKLLVQRLLQPALGLAEPVRLVCHEGSLDRLLANLAEHTLDIVLADSAVPSGSAVRAHNHLLGECGVGFFATASLAWVYRDGFPASLNGAPFLLPAETVILRRSLNVWLDKHGLVPRVVAEFEDSALLKMFGSEGVGVFAAPLAVAGDVKERYRVEYLGPAGGVTERIYAISAERRLKHPGVLAIARTAHQEVLASVQSTHGAGE
jgi:LysR family transcriptional activator of nhaA